MRSYGLPSFFFLLILAAAITLACGSPVSHVAPNCSSAPTAANSGMPQSVTLCPAVADARITPVAKFSSLPSEPSRRRRRLLD